MSLLDKELKRQKISEIFCFLFDVLLPFHRKCSAKWWKLICKTQKIDGCSDQWEAAVPVRWS